ncbi:MAG: hypothetical protein ACYCY0_09400, partial [Acidithiobacillus ferrivorans]
LYGGHNYALQVVRAGAVCGKLRVSIAASCSGFAVVGLGGCFNVSRPVFYYSNTAKKGNTG